MTELTTKEIYQNACAQIASVFEQDGFKYFKSKPKLKKVVGDLTFEITFRSSMYNSKSYKVEIDAHAWVKSKKLKRWRLTQPQCKNSVGEVDDVIARTAISSIPEKRIIGHWNLLDESSRQETIAKIVTLIRQSVLPYFDKFSEPEVIANTLILDHGRHLGMSAPCEFIEFALCFFDDSLAKAMAEAYLRILFKSERNVDGLDDFIDAYKAYEGLALSDDHRPWGHANEVAYYALKYHWGNIAETISEEMR